MYGALQMEGCPRAARDTHGPLRVAQSARFHPDISKAVGHPALFAVHAPRCARSTSREFVHKRRQRLRRFVQLCVYTSISTHTVA